MGLGWVGFYNYVCGDMYFGPCALIFWVSMRSWPSILGVSFDFLCPDFKNSVNLGWSAKGLDVFYVFQNITDHVCYMVI